MIIIGSDQLWSHKHNWISVDFCTKRLFLGVLFPFQPLWLSKTDPLFIYNFHFVIEGGTISIEMLLILCHVLWILILNKQWHANETLFCFKNLAGITSVISHQTMHQYTNRLTNVLYYVISFNHLYWFRALSTMLLFTKGNNKLVFHCWFLLFFFLFFIFLHILSLPFLDQV